MRNRQSDLGHQGFIISWMSHERNLIERLRIPVKTMLLDDCCLPPTTFSFSTCTDQAHTHDVSQLQALDSFVCHAHEQALLHIHNRVKACCPHRVKGGPTSIALAVQCRHDCDHCHLCQARAAHPPSTLQQRQAYGNVILAALSSLCCTPAVNLTADPPQPLGPCKAGRTARWITHLCAFIISSAFSMGQEKCTAKEMK